MTEMPHIQDPRGVQIVRGARVAPYHDVPPGVVTDLFETDEGQHPQVEVTYSDGSMELWPTSPCGPSYASYTCDEVEIQLCPFCQRPHNWIDHPCTYMQAEEDAAAQLLADSLAKRAADEQQIQSQDHVVVLLDTEDERVKHALVSVLGPMTRADATQAEQQINTSTDVGVYADAVAISPFQLEDVADLLAELQGESDG